MVKQVIEQHNGTVDIASTPGKGTKVTIHLPHGAAPAAEVHVAEAKSFQLELAEAAHPLSSS